MLFITVLILSILTGAELDLFTPSFPEIQKIFNLSPFILELMLSVNLIAHCLSSLIAGNLGDRYGRRNIIILGLWIFIVGSLICFLANNYLYLLLGRALQGIGISGPAVLAFLVITDNCSLIKQQHNMGLLNGLVTLAMIVAPICGSYISLWFKWRGNFLVLLIFGIICLMLSIIFIPTDKTIHRISFHLKEYKIIFTNKTIMIFIGTIWLLSQSYWIFIGMSPMLYMNSLKVSLKDFGLYQGSICVSFAIISLTNGYFIRKFGQKKCLLFGILILLCFIILTSILLIFKIESPLIITLVLQLEGIGVVFPINILWPLALNYLPEAKSRLASILVSGRLIITSISLQIVGFLYKESFFEIGMAMIVSLILALIMLSKLLKIITEKIN